MVRERAVLGMVGAGCEWTLVPTGRVVGKNDVDRQDEGPDTAIEPLTVLKPGGGVSGLDGHSRKITPAITWKVAWELDWTR